MIMTYAELTGDYTPVHRQAYAKTTHSGTRVARQPPGLDRRWFEDPADYRFLPGMSLGWTWDFAGPIKIGDTPRAFRSGACPTKRPRWAS
jgi:acyl dehydratase